MHVFLEVVGYVVKVCGHLIFGNLTYPIAFACVLPSMIGPTMLVTSKTWLGMLYCQYAGAKHMSLGCVLPGHHMPQFVPWVDLEFLVIPGQIVFVLCGLVGYCSLLCVDFTVSLVDLGPLRLGYPQWSDVFCICVVHVVYLGCGFETLN